MTQLTLAAESILHLLFAIVEPIKLLIGANARQTLLLRDV